MMPMFRVFSSEYCRCTVSPSSSLLTSSNYLRAISPLGSAVERPRLALPGTATVRTKRGVSPRPPSWVFSLLPAVMGKGLVGLCHLVRVLSFLHGGAAVVAGVQQLGGQFVRHAALGPPTGGADHPAHGQGGASLRAHLHRDLIRRPTH